MVDQEQALLGTAVTIKDQSLTAPLGKKRGFFKGWGVSQIVFYSGLPYVVSKGIKI